MSAIPPDQAQKALQVLGVTQADLDTIRTSPFAQAQTLLQDLKANAHRKYKQLALEYHPDRTRGDNSKTEFWLLLGQVLEELDKTTVQSRPTAPRFKSVTYIPIQRVPNRPITFWQQVGGAGDPPSQGFTVTQVRRVVKMRPK